MKEHTQITYSLNEHLQGNELADLFKASGINRPIDDLKRLQKMIDHANLLVTAYDGEKLIGIARALTDFSYCCYLSDLAVHQDYQRNGIGKKLISLVHQEIGDECTFLLLSAPSAMDYYPQTGFAKADNAFTIIRKQ
ncbi:GNAT family N-acetyltransferase [Bacillus testis]|uniref:GNAT family N-acetyltransferase n=1 Tax=Bacillus testis TaxID=1622072 RepID=UPI00067EBF67|nr:GNAT family N-acetyltransferase [Bacillus testis]